MLYKKFESWSEVEKPPFSNIPIIGCCEEHEQQGDFKWYRSHTWQEFRELLQKGDSFLTREAPFDIFQFISLHPIVHRYYMKGALSLLAQLVDRVSSFEELPYEFWQWIEYAENTSNIEKNSFAGMGYSKAEVQDIIGLVESIKEKLKVEDEEDKQKIDSTLEFWQEAYKNL
jgi:hypothetical protein